MAVVPDGHNFVGRIWNHTKDALYAQIVPTQAHFEKLVLEKIYPNTVQKVS